MMNFQPRKPRAVGSTKEVVTRLLDEAGGAKMAAHLLGCSPTQAVAYSDPATPEEIKFDQVRRLVSASGATAPVQDLALLAGGVFIPMGSSSECVDRLAARTAQQFGEFTAELFVALADGKVCKLDAEKIFPDLHDVIRCLVHIAGLLNQNSGSGEPQ